ncbi:bromodomain-containing protein 4-like [Polyodon spathula]|uniref:bromodomain-containing protein 4-like n=1 Tax=Polyodon spathula TaxID=7913 RepID=UPI001B7E841F|nr:bromodomain-containing protein 4-like [Polyodon spathula]
MTAIVAPTAPNKETNRCPLCNRDPSSITTTETNRCSLQTHDPLLYHHHRNQLLAQLHPRPPPLSPPQKPTAATCIPATPSSITTTETNRCPLQTGDPLLYHHHRNQPLTPSDQRPPPLPPPQKPNAAPFIPATPSSITTTETNRCHLHTRDPLIYHHHRNQPLPPSDRNQTLPPSYPRPPPLSPPQKPTAATCIPVTPSSITTTETNRCPLQTGDPLLYHHHRNQPLTPSDPRPPPLPPPQKPTAAPFIPATPSSITTTETNRCPLQTCDPLLYHQHRNQPLPPLHPRPTPLSPPQKHAAAPFRPGTPSYFTTTETNRYHIQTRNPLLYHHHRNQPLPPSDPRPPPLSPAQKPTAAPFAPATHSSITTTETCRCPLQTRDPLLFHQPRNQPLPHSDPRLPPLSPPQKPATAPFRPATPSAITTTETNRCPLHTRDPLLYHHHRNQPLPPSYPRTPPISPPQKPTAAPFRPATLSAITTTETKRCPLQTRDPLSITTTETNRCPFQTRDPLLYHQHRNQPLAPLQPRPTPLSPPQKPFMTDPHHFHP